MKTFASDNCGAAAFEAGKKASSFLSFYFLMLFICFVVTCGSESKEPIKIPIVLLYLEKEVAALSLAVLGMISLYRYYCMICYERMLIYKLQEEQKKQNETTHFGWFSTYPSVDNFHLWIGSISSTGMICSWASGPFIKVSGLIFLPILICSVLDWQSLEPVLWCLLALFALFWLGTVLMMATENSVTKSGGKFIETLDGAGSVNCSQNQASA